MLFDKASIRLKNEKQLAGIRESCRLLAETHARLRPLVVPGALPRDIDAVAREHIEANGGRPAFLGYHGFPASICFSLNEAVIHGIPDSTPLRNGDVVSIDCGIELNGYYSDSAMTVVAGETTPEVSELMRVAEESLELGIQAAVSGNRVKDISAAIYEHNKAHGYGIVRPYCGHGVGLSLHEDPQVPNYVGRGPNPRLKPGMVLALEPMINLGSDDVEVLEDDWTVVTADNSISVHFEHTVAIHADHTEVMTRQRTPETA